MRSIYKYDISTDNGIIKGPITKLLTAQVQNGAIVIWAEIDTNKPERKFQIVPIGTGWPLDPPAGKDCVLDTHTYIGTVQLAGGSLVLHIYGAEIVSKTVKNKTPEGAKTTRVAAKNQNEATFTGTAVINPEILSIFIR